MYFLSHGPVAPGPNVRPMVLQEHDPIVGHEIVRLVEELAEAADADVLEHAHRDDAVEAARDFAVVLKAELDAPGQRRFARPRLRRLQLLGRERHPRDVGAGDLRQVEGESAPARADVEHPALRLEQKLRRDVALLVVLGRL